MTDSDVIRTRTEGHIFEVTLDRLTSLDGVRVPGARRHRNRLDPGPRAINSALVETIRGLL